jgi:streptogramin lyase
MKRFVIGILLAALSVGPFLTSANVSAVTSSTSITPEFAWSNAGPNGLEFSNPYGVAIAPSGNIYVIDQGNAAIKEFKRDGSFVRSWGTPGTGDGEFDIATDIAIAPNGNVFVTDMGVSTGRVQVFSSDGTFLSSWGSYGTDDDQFIMPASIALAPNGDVYVGEYFGIKKFTNTGTFITKWGEGAGDLPYGLAVAPNGDVYGAYLSTSSVRQYTPDGTLVTSWGSLGSADGEFSATGPMRLTITANSHVYVTDPDNNRVQEFTSDGTFVSKWGAAGSGAGQFNQPFGIASDGKGDMYVTDYGNNRIQRYFFPQNISNVTVGSSEISITLPQGCDISDHSMLTPAKSDKMYSYPLGLTSFTFSTPDCVSGATVPVTLSFQTDLKANEVVARKYNSNTQTYNTIAGATITETTIDGQPALQLSYSVTDGGPLDEDGVANGVIVDPVGLGTLTGTATIGAPNTGVGLPESFARQTIVFALIASCGITVLSILMYQLVKKMASSGRQ